LADAADIQRELEDEHERRLKRFRILVCIDGSEESYRGLDYAARMGGADDCDIILLYVRTIDQGLHSGGMQVRVARENMLSWGLELPGIRYLRKGLDLLIENAELEEQWSSTVTHTDVEGDPLGDNKVEYRNTTGKSIVLKLKTAHDPASGILDQYELGPYNLIILGADRKRGLFSRQIAQRVARHAPCSVLAARELVPGRGHLVCTDGSDMALDAVRRDALMAQRFQAPMVSLISIARDDGDLQAAEDAVARAKDAVSDIGLEVLNTYARIGDPVDEIIEAGKEYSLIVMSDTSKSSIKRMLVGSVSSKVLAKAHNSVLIIR